MSEHTAPRLEVLLPAGLDEPRAVLRESIAGGPRADGAFRLVDDDGGLLGPFNALLHHPDVGGPIERLGAALRFGGVLPARTRELVVCAVAAHWESAYEWYAHRRVASRLGVTEEELATLAAGEVPADLDAAEQAALALARALLRRRAVPDEVYGAAAAQHAAAGLVEVAAVVGYYQLLAGLLATFDVGAPEEES